MEQFHQLLHGDAQAVPAMVQAFVHHLHTDHVEGHPCYTCESMCAGLQQLATYAVQPLLAAVKETRTTHPGLIQLLGELHDPRAVEPLIAILENQNYPRQPRTYIPLALLALEDKRAIDLLLQVFLNASEEVDIRTEAGTALSGFAEVFPDDNATSPIMNAFITVLDDAQAVQDIRTHAAFLLGFLSSPETSASLRRVLQHADTAFQRVVVQSLRRLKDPIIYKEGFQRLFPHESLQQKRKLRGR